MVPEDLGVEEVPLYLPTGRGEHTLFYIAKRGVPNGFGYQRFGLTGRNHRLGRLLVEGHVDHFVQAYLGSDRRDDSSAEARVLFSEGNLDAALEAWPRHLTVERRALPRRWR